MRIAAHHHHFEYARGKGVMQGPVERVMTEPLLQEAFGHRIVRVAAGGQTLFVAE